MTAEQLAARVADEIRDHHIVIERWLTGEAARTEPEFALFADAHAPDFTLITPGGQILSGTDVLGAVRDAHGSVPGLRLLISDVRLVASDGAVHVATYRELHEDDTAAPQARRATVVLLDDARAPRGFRWTHLHETWEA